MTPTPSFLWSDFANRSPLKTMKSRLAIFLVASAAVFAGSRAANGIALNVGNATTSPGQAATFQVTLTGIAQLGFGVNNAQLDIIFDLSVFEPPSDAREACQVTPRLANLVHTESLP